MQALGRKPTARLLNKHIVAADEVVAHKLKLSIRTCRVAEDEVLPIVYHTRPTTCTRRQLKGLTVMVDSQYNGRRMEDVWLER